MADKKLIHPSRFRNKVQQFAILIEHANLAWPAPATDQQMSFGVDTKGVDLHPITRTGRNLDQPGLLVGCTFIDVGDRNGLEPGGSCDLRLNWRVNQGRGQ